MTFFYYPDVSFFPGLEVENCGSNEGEGGGGRRAVAVRPEVVLVGGLGIPSRCRHEVPNSELFLSRR